MLASNNDFDIEFFMASTPFMSSAIMLSSNNIITIKEGFSTLAHARQINCPDTFWVNCAGSYCSASVNYVGLPFCYHPLCQLG